MTEFVVDVSCMSKWKLHRLLKPVKGSFVPDEFDKEYEPQPVNFRDGKVKMGRTTISFGQGLVFECSNVELSVPQQQFEPVALHGHTMLFAGRRKQEDFTMRMVLPLVGNAAAQEFFQEWIDQLRPRGEGFDGAADAIERMHTLKRNAVVTSSGTEIEVHGVFPTTAQVTYNQEQPIHSIDRFDEDPSPVSIALEVYLRFDFYNEPREL